MHPAIQTLKNALGYAKFADPDLKEAVDGLVDQVGSELEDESYEQGSGVELAMREVEDVLNRTDSSIEDTDEAIRNADASDEVEEVEEP